MYYVYLLASEADPSRRYVGYSENLRGRLADHNEGKCASTRLHRPWQLRTYLAFATKPPALAFERYLKSGSGHAFANQRLW